MVQAVIVGMLFAVMFMRANIVGTVIILSLVIWIPASCIVAYIVSVNNVCHQLFCYLKLGCRHVSCSDVLMRTVNLIAHA